MDTPVLRFAPFGTGGRNQIAHEINVARNYRETALSRRSTIERALNAIPADTIEAVGTKHAAERDVKNFTFLKNIIRVVQTHELERPARQNAIAEYEANYDRYTKQLIELQARLAKQADGDKTFTQAQLDQIMARIPDTKATGDGETLILKFDNVIMSPDTNHYININGGDPVNIHLGTVTARVNISVGELNITGTVNRNGGWGDRCHPHVLSGNKPCLGGFEGTLYDAYQKADIEVIALIIRMFLSQANVNDGAGSAWTRWMPKNIRDHITGENRSWYVNNGKLIRYTNYTVHEDGTGSIGDTEVGLFSSAISIESRNIDHAALWDHIGETSEEAKQEILNFIGTSPVHILYPSRRVL